MIQGHSNMPRIIDICCVRDVQLFLEDPKLLVVHLVVQKEANEHTSWQHWMWLDSAYMGQKQRENFFFFIGNFRPKEKQKKKGIRYVYRIRGNSRKTYIIFWFWIFAKLHLNKMGEILGYFRLIIVPSQIVNQHTLNTYYNTFILLANVTRR